jgi:hypothetical protein
MPLNLPWTRGYDRGFDWGYGPETTGRPPGERRELIPVVWDGLWLNSGDLDSGLCVVVEDIDGWLDSAPLDGNDVARVISDGASWGPKVIRQRVITISGAVTGPRDLLGQFRDQLAVRAAARQPALLAIGDWDLARVLTADVRAGSELYRHKPLGSTGFRWQVTLTAADPARYAGAWQTAVLRNAGDEGTGRLYARDYRWNYRSPYLPNTAVLRNDGNAPAPVYALYEGDLTRSTLTDPHGGILLMDSIGAGMQITVATAALTAEAPGGYSRAPYILPGSRPMQVPPQSSSRWYLRSAGRGSITLAWRSTWA